MCGRNIVDSLQTKHHTYIHFKPLSSGQSISWNQKPIIKSPRHSLQHYFRKPLRKTNVAMKEFPTIWILVEERLHCIITIVERKKKMKMVQVFKCNFYGFNHFQHFYLNSYIFMQLFTGRYSKIFSNDVSSTSTAIMHKMNHWENWNNNNCSANYSL